MNKRSRSIGECIDQRETMKKRINYLPMEVVEEEILWRLPLKSIIRMGSVCKSWYSLIRTRHFISKTKKSPQVFLRNYDSDRREHGQLSFILENHNHPFDHVDQLDLRVIRLPPSLDFNILGSCNGVMCVFCIQDMSTFILCNPSIRRSLTLPMPQLVPFFNPTGPPTQLQCQLFGFAFHDGDYKILRIISSSSTDWAAELYSLNSNSWRAIPIPIHGVPHFDYFKNTEAAFVRGRLHWIVRHFHQRSRKFILAFDLNDETFHHIELPNFCMGHSLLKVVAFQESSIVVIQGDTNQRVVPAWIMKDEYLGPELDYWWSRIIIDLLDSRLLGSPITNDHNFFEVALRFEASPLQHVPSLVLLDT